MGTALDQTVRVLDQKIQETEKNLEEARRVAERIPVLTSDLAALRRARDVLLGNDTTAETADASEPESIPSNGHPAKTSLLISILQEAGRPLRVAEIVERAHAKGSRGTKATIVGQLSRWVKEEKLRRPAPSTYALRK